MGSVQYDAPRGSMAVFSASFEQAIIRAYPSDSIPNAPRPTCFRTAGQQANPPVAPGARTAEYRDGIALPRRLVGATESLVRKPPAEDACLRETRTVSRKPRPHGRVRGGPSAGPTFVFDSWMDVPPAARQALSSAPRAPRLQQRPE